MRPFTHNVGPLYHVATGSVKDFRHLAALSGVFLGLLWGFSQVSQGDLFIICTAAGEIGIIFSVFSEFCGDSLQTYIPISYILFTI